MIVNSCKYYPFLLLVMLLLQACRKDLLHWEQVQKLETHTTTDRLNKILFLNDSVGFAVGGDRFLNAVILTTGNGGKDWSYRTFPEAGKALYGISQDGEGNIYAVGFDGKMLKSEDQGGSWKFSQLIYNPYKDICFINSDHGIAVGGISYHTGYIERLKNDGTLIRWDTAAYELNDIEMISPASGYICGFGIVLKTTDSGTSWQAQSAKNDNFTAIHSYGAAEAWTCGYNGSIYHTADGGNTWERMRNGNDITLPRYKLQDILFTDALNGYAVGEDGLVIHTDDGGRHWMEFDRFTSNHLRCIVTQKDGSLLVCGDHGSLYRILQR